MTNPSKQRGTAFETAIVNYLEDNGFPFAERRALRGNKDCGDIAGIPGVVLELKACKRLELAGWCDELEAEIRNAEAQTGAVIVKRTRRPIRESYVVLPLHRYLNMIR